MVHSKLLLNLNIFLVLLFTFLFVKTRSHKSHLNHHLLKKNKKKPVIYFYVFTLNSCTNKPIKFVIKNVNKIKYLNC